MRCNIKLKKVTVQSIALRRGRLRKRIAVIAEACPPPDIGQWEGPDGDKWSLDHAGNVGRGRSERSERSPPQSQLSSRCNIK